MLTPFKMKGGVSSPAKGIMDAIKGALSGALGIGVGGGDDGRMTEEEAAAMRAETVRSHNPNVRTVRANKVLPHGNEAHTGHGAGAGKNINTSTSTDPFLAGGTSSGLLGDSTEGGVTVKEQPDSGTSDGNMFDSSWRDQFMENQTSGLTYKMPAAGKYKNSPIEKNYGSPAQRGFTDTPLEMRSFGVGSLKGGTNAPGRSKTGAGGKFND